MEKGQTEVMDYLYAQNPWRWSDNRGSSEEEVEMLEGGTRMPGNQSVAVKSENFRQDYRFMISGIKAYSSPPFCKNGGIKANLGTLHHIS